MSQPEMVVSAAVVVLAQDLRVPIEGVISYAAQRCTPKTRHDHAIVIADERGSRIDPRQLLCELVEYTRQVNAASGWHGGLLGQLGLALANENMAPDKLKLLLIKALDDLIRNQAWALRLSQQRGAKKLMAR